jgi:hypothetical protein
MLHGFTPRRAATRASLATFLFMLCAVVYAPPAAAQDALQGVTPGSCWLN